MKPEWNRTMTTITVKDIPDELYQRLKAAAQSSRRSINSEIIVCLERALTSRRVETEGLLATARSLRERVARRPFAVAELDEARTQGRP